MRINQIKNVCWLGNGLVFLGVGWVVLVFVSTYKARGERVTVEFPGESDVSASIERRWPGDVRGFTSIWDTNVNGEIPPPPEVNKTKPKEIPRADRFRNRTSIVTGIFRADDPYRSVPVVKHDQLEPKGIEMRTGQMLGEWQLVDIEYEAESGLFVLVFGHDKEDEPVRISETDDAVRLPTASGDRPLIPVGEDGPIQVTVKRGEIAAMAYRDPRDDSGNTWIIPEEEVEWWRTYGEEDVFAKLNLKPRPDGGGVTVTSPPASGTPVGRGGNLHGITKGETLISINGVAIANKEDVLLYLRGDGKGLKRYEVVIESVTGKSRTHVYRLPGSRVRR